MDDGWIDAANLELTLDDRMIDDPMIDDLDEIAKAIDRSGAGSGPAMPNLGVAA